MSFPFSRALKSKRVRKILANLDNNHKQQRGVCLWVWLTVEFLELFSYHSDSLVGEAFWELNKGGR